MNAPLTKGEQELLRLAAKAAGRVPDVIDGDGAWFRGPADPVVGAWSRWDPLRVDGHAFQLAMQLQIDIVAYSHHDGTPGVCAKYNDQCWHIALVVADRDVCASARLAIVECAADFARKYRKDTTS